MSKFIANIPEPDYLRIVIIGAGFAGLRLARKMAGTKYQVILLDKNNYHQFQPLFYQVAMAGLEANAVAFPLRNALQSKSNVFFRMAEMKEVNLEKKYIETSLGRLSYDHLVLAAGTVTNYFGIRSIEDNALAMKTLSDSIYLRNTILNKFEMALNVTDREELDALMNIVVTGGGPTGVELAGALAEMKKFILPKDYPGLDLSLMNIYLFEGLEDLLSGMSRKAKENARAYLEKLGVIVRTGVFVKEFEDHTVTLSNGEKLKSRTVIWAAGVKSEKIIGIPDKVISKGGRIEVDSYSRAKGMDQEFVIGDQALMVSDEYPDGHPQIAQPAIQQADNLAGNFKRSIKGKEWKPFTYHDKGSMATIGRHLAVADLPFIRLKGYLAWLLWSVVHLFSIIGTRNKLVIFLNWIWNYFSYNQALGLIIRHKAPNGEKQ